MNKELPPADPDRAEIAEGQARATIALPYSLSNMVFIEAAPLWLCLILGIVGGAAGLLGLTGAESHGILIVSAVFALIGAVGLLVFWYALWRWAVRGYSVAIYVLYAFYLFDMVVGPLIVLLIGSFTLGPVVLQLSGGPRGGGSPAAAFVLLAVLALFGLAWLLALTNIFEREFWRFARLDGLCPSCRQWRFGPVKRPGTVTCAHCGAVLEFVRAGEPEKADKP